MRRLLIATAVAAAVTPAVAQTHYAPGYVVGPSGGPIIFDPDATGSIVVTPGYANPQGGDRRLGYGDDTPGASNAEALTKPQQNYGQVSGGYEE